MRRPKLTYYLRWHKDQYPERYRFRKQIFINEPLYKRDEYLGYVSGMGWEGDRFVLDLL